MQSAGPDQRGRPFGRAAGRLSDRRARDGAAAAGARDRGQRRAQPALGPLPLHRRRRANGATRARRCRSRTRSRGDAAAAATCEPDVAERRGCDPSPLDPASRRRRGSRSCPTSGRTSSGASTQLRAALDLAPSLPVDVERASAVEWLDERARRAAARASQRSSSTRSCCPTSGSRASRDLWHTLEAAGGRARGDAPLAWLQPGGRRATRRTCG